MKLVDLLARELESWPKCGCMTQDHNGELYGWTSNPVWNRYEWIIDKGAAVQVRRPVYIALAEDHSTAIITRDMWQSARDKLKGETKVPKANKDGWIRHRSGKCPVEYGETVEVRYRDGTVEVIDAQFKFAWAHDGASYDIMAYRIHAPGQQHSNADKLELECTVNTEGVREVIEEMQTQIDQIDGPIKWRDRIREIDSTVEALEEERASLIQRLADEGFKLMRVDGKAMPKQPIKEADSAQGEDMSDPGNWKVGDFVVCLESDEDIGHGCIYQLTRIEGNHIKFRDSAGDNRTRYASDYKWHSRPSK